VPNFWIGLVPFGDVVRLGTEYPNFMDTTYDPMLEFGPVISGSTCPAYSGASPITHSSSPSRCSYTMPGTAKPFFGFTSNWAGCVLARANGLEESDQAPSSGVAGSYYRAYSYASTATGISGSNTCTGGSNAWMCSKTTTVAGVTTTQTMYNSVTATSGPNQACTVAAVQSMVAERSTITSAINTMTAGGNTAINLGAAWGYRMLSPNWAGMWGGEMNATGNAQYPQLPLPYNTPLMNKVVILMTDGMNNPPGGTAGTAYVGQSAPTVASLDTSTKAVCDNMKSHNIIIYTIGFGTTDDNNPSNPTSVNGPLLKYCATQLYPGDTSHYFLATGSISLNNAFSQIGSSLANLRVSQ
jgi:hypothetical protein